MTYRIGDKVTYEGEITGVYDSWIRVRLPCGDMFNPIHGAESSHTPAPREFKPGDKVAFIGMNRYEYHGEIIAIHNGRAIVYIGAYIDSYFWPLLTDLRHVD